MSASLGYRKNLCGALGLKHISALVVNIFIVGLFVLVKLVFS